MGESESLSVRGAVQTLEQMEGMHEALRRRTSGITWMIWGIVTPGIFFTYSFWALVVEFYAPSWGGAFPFLWIPWIIAGVAATVALWRSAGLVVPTVGNRRQGILTFLVFLLVMNFAWPVSEAVGFGLVEPALMMVALGFGNVALGVMGVNCPTREERVLTLSVGAGLIVVALAGSAGVAGRDAAYALFSIVAPLVTGMAYFVNGAWLTLRG